MRGLALSAGSEAGEVATSRQARPDSGESGLSSVLAVLAVC